MTENREDTDVLVGKSVAGDEAALSDLLSRHLPRLTKMVLMRIDRRLEGRVNASEVIRKVFDDLPNRLPEYGRDRRKPFYLWLRLITAEQLAEVHRQFLQSSPSTNSEVSLYHGRMPRANSVLLASQLLGRVAGAGQKAGRAEMQLKLQQVLNAMEPMDREILALKHFEELDNEEIVEVLPLSKARLGKLYVRALRRLRESLERSTGMLD